MNEHIKNAIGRIRTAIRHMDNVQTRKADTDKLADAAMHLDLAIEELEDAESKPQLTINMQTRPDEKDARMYSMQDEAAEPTGPRWPGDDGSLPCDPHKQSKPEPTEFRKECTEIREIYLQKEPKTLEAARWLVKRLASQLRKACDIIESQAEHIKQYKEMINIPDLLTDGFLAVGQELINRAKQIAAANKEIETLKSKNAQAISTIYDQERLLDLREKEIERLKDALRKYGKHIKVASGRQCDIHVKRTPLYASGGICNCGFEQALKGE